MEFALDPRLEADTAFIVDWGLSRVLLMDDARFPWLILVPRRAAMRELFDLPPDDRAMLIEEASRAGGALLRLTGCDKANFGALGNVVPQFHLHIVARNRGDAAWPGPVWGYGTRVPYATEERAAFLARLVNVL